MTSLVAVSSRERRAFTLVEVLISITLLSVVTVAMSLMLQRQQRFYRAQSGVINLYSQLRQAGEVLPSELRALSTADAAPVADIYAMSDTSIDIRSMFGSSIACQIPTVSQIVLPPLATARGNALTSWIRPPVVGDSVFVLDDSTGTGAPGTWRAHEITAIASAAGACPAATNYTEAADAGQLGYTITVSPDLTATTIAGAPLRFFRRAHYALYASGDEWYLGYFDCSPGCGALEPVSGPYLPYVAGAPGVGFEYFDSLGVVTAVPRNVARIRVTARGMTERAVSTGRGSAGSVTDSARYDIALRNRR